MMKAYGRDNGIHASTCTKLGARRTSIPVAPSRSLFVSWPLRMVSRPRLVPVVFTGVDLEPLSVCCCFLCVSPILQSNKLPSSLLRSSLEVGAGPQVLFLPATTIGQVVSLFPTCNMLGFNCTSTSCKCFGTFCHKLTNV